MDFVNLSDSSTADLNIKHSYGVQACVAAPYVFLVGQLQTNASNGLLNVSRTNCNSTDCVGPHNKGSDLLVLNQPSSIMLPTKLVEPRYDDSGVRTLLEMRSASSRDKGIIGLVVVGLVAFVSLIAVAVTAAVALSQSRQNANFVNELAHNTSMAMKTQDTDLKLEVKLNALESVVVQIGI